LTRIVVLTRITASESEGRPPARPPAGRRDGGGRLGKGGNLGRVSRRPGGPRDGGPGCPPARGGGRAAGGDWLIPSPPLPPPFALSGGVSASPSPSPLSNGQIYWNSCQTMPSGCVGLCAAEWRAGGGGDSESRLGSARARAGAADTPEWKAPAACGGRPAVLRPTAPWFLAASEKIARRT
jgi:hypothetical protein